MGIFEVILAFMEKGGNVLWLIAALVFFMWTLIFERVWYFRLCLEGGQVRCSECLGRPQ